MSSRTAGSSSSTPAIRTSAADTVRIGLFCGLAVGAGFAVLETLGYAYAAVVEDGASLRTVDELLAVRGLFSPATHLTWSALNAAAATMLLLALPGPGTWRDSQRLRPRVVAVAVLLGTLLATVTMHAVWDTYPSWLPHLVITVIGLTALGLVDRRLRGAAQKRSLTLTLAEELRGP
jgi:protease PrsW